MNLLSTIKARIKLIRDKRTISKSKLFDVDFYLQAYSDVAASGIAPIAHYLMYGAKEGKNPSRIFNTKWYLSQYEDVAKSGMNPLVHYLLCGQEEGRKCTVGSAFSDAESENGIRTWSLTNRIDIIDLEHKDSLSQQYKVHLEKMGYQCNILKEEPDRYDLIPYFVIFTTKLKRMPNVYYIVQTEPITDESLASEKYCNILNGANQILAGTVSNIAILKESKKIKDCSKIFYLPDPGQDFENHRNMFVFYFYRFLLALEFICFEQFYQAAGKEFDYKGDKLCLSLPESTVRREAFDKENQYGFEYVPGLRHHIGWVGCGMSYKLIFRKAIEKDLDRLTICEDDVHFPADYAEKINAIEDCLTGENWDVFSGIMADVGNVHIKQTKEFGHDMFVSVNRLISMVYNIYNKSIFSKITDWDEKNCVITNTVDRYLEQFDLNVWLILPFFVGHKANLDSTLWDKDNSFYDPFIQKSEQKLTELAIQYEALHFLCSNRMQRKESHLTDTPKALSAIKNITQ